MDLLDPVAYRVTLLPRRHLLTVVARFPQAARETDGSLLLHLPVWTPGSYLVREYARHLQDLVAVDGDGTPLAVRKIDKSSFRVDGGAAAAIEVRYAIYAHEVTVRTCHVDDSHGYWNGACVFLYSLRTRHHPAEVTVAAPAGWSVFTALAEAGEGRFRAADYDTLVDSPCEVGPHTPSELTVLGKAHRLVVWGLLGDDDRRRLVEDLGRIVAAQGALWGGLPYQRYTFLLHLVPGGYGGLEHADSTTVLASSLAFGNRKRYEELLELLAHEFFHLWNVKRIHPLALGPFDYQREAATRSLWVCEGWTSYYDRLLVRRAGLLSPRRYLEQLGDDVNKLRATPGRLHHSLEAASFDAWIKHYRPDENTVNTTVSYYLKGALVALLLDLEIRRRSEGRRSLDDVLGLLWERHGATGQGYADEAIQSLVEEGSGLSLGDFFERAVRGTEELDLGPPLAEVGLDLRPAKPERPDDRGAWLGVNVAQEGERLRITETLEGGPGQLGGLCPGDQLLAWNGLRLDQERLTDRLAEAPPTASVRLSLFRRDELREVTLALAPRPPSLRKLEVAFSDDAGEPAKRAYEAWLGAPWGQLE